MKTRTRTPAALLLLLLAAGACAPTCLCEEEEHRPRAGVRSAMLRRAEGPGDHVLHVRAAQVRPSGAGFVEGDES